MMTKSATGQIAVGVFLCGLFAAINAKAAVNSWTNANSAKWETPANWSAGAPGAAQSIYITNANSKTVTIDATTSGSFSNTMSINDLNLFGVSSSSTNSLALTNAGTATPLQVATTLFVGSGFSPGFLTISSSALQVGSTTYLNQGKITLNSGLLNATNGSFIIGNTPGGPGSLIVNGGLALFGPVDVSEYLSDTGFWTINGGTNICYSSITVANYGTGTLAVNGGRLTVNNTGAGYLRLADNITNSAGTLSMANGEVDANFLQIGYDGQGALIMGGGLMTVASNLVVGYSPGSSGSALINGGTLAVTNSARNATVEIRRGSMTLNIAALQMDNLVISNSSTASGSGNLTVQTNAAMTINSNLTLVSSSLTLTSSITLNGGFVWVTNGLTQVGRSGNGLMTISGGSNIFRQIILGSTNGSGSGGLHLTGGHLKVLGNGIGPGQGLVSNWILWEGGDLDGSGTSLTIGLNASSDVNIPFSPGTTPVTGQLGALYVGAGAGFTGTYTQSGIGCQIVVSNQMILGDCNNGAIGQATLNNGTLYVTNPMHTAILDVRNGSFTLNPGATLVVDNLIITNACGHFYKSPGSTIVTINPPLLSANLDADGDGVSNGLEQALGMDPLNPSFICAPSGILDWWPAGGNANDIIGNNNGILQNGTTFAPGKVGQAFSFDGINNSILIGGSPIPPPWTTELWVNRQNSPAYSSVLLADDVTALKLEQYNFTRKVGFTQFGVNDYAFNYIAPIGVWVHLAFVCDGNSTALYVNGLLQDTIDIPINLPLSQLGSDGSGDRLKGLVDEIAVYNRVLSAAEIQAIYNAGSAGKCVTPVYITSMNIVEQNLSVTWLAQPGLIYQLQYTTDLNSGLWTAVMGNITATGSTAGATDVLPANAMRRFYRVVLFR